MSARYIETMLNVLIIATMAVAIAIIDLSALLFYLAGVAFGYGLRIATAHRHGGGNLR